MSLIATVCDNLKAFLLAKNKLYGNSALEPLEIFDKSDTENSICTRIDDKLSRIKNADKLRKNDVVDLAGYLILLCVNKEWVNFDEFLD